MSLQQIGTEFKKKKKKKNVSQAVAGHAAQVEQEEMSAGILWTGSV